MVFSVDIGRIFCNMERRGDVLTGLGQAGEVVYQLCMGRKRGILTELGQERCCTDTGCKGGALTGHGL